MQLNITVQVAAAAEGGSLYTGCTGEKVYLLDSRGEAILVGFLSL